MEGSSVNQRHAPQFGLDVTRRLDFLFLDMAQMAETYQRIYEALLAGGGGRRRDASSAGSVA